MFFNSISFAIFFPIVFILYWFVFGKSKIRQNVLLIVASYYFYSCWDWRFLFLLIFSTGLDFFSAIMIQNSSNDLRRKFYLYFSITINLGLLGVFKYYDFFIKSFSSLLGNLGLETNATTLSLILPVGISFYTFHGLSYIIDVYKGRIKAEKNFIDYSLFVSFFPLLVAGPIERATHLLPQVKVRRSFNFNQSKDGIKLIVFGLFKKIVVADNCAFFVNQIFESYSDFSSTELWIGAILFAFQIYGDFSGYSDIAIGTSKLLGIELLKNFNFPYFSKDIADFWRRWHISLSSWFRDYLYIPLGGSKGTKIIQIRNVFIIFLVSGFWHGANWTFIFWGLIHALLFVPLLIMNKNRNNLNSTKYTYSDFPKIFITFITVCIAWVFFRSDTLLESFGYLHCMFNIKSFSVHYFFKNSKFILLTIITFLSIFTLLMVEYRMFREEDKMIYFSKKLIFVIVSMILFMGVYRNQLTFIYFQF